MATTIDQARIRDWYAQHAITINQNDAYLLAETDRKLIGLISYRLLNPDTPPTNPLRLLYQHLPCGRSHANHCMQRPQHIRLRHMLTIPDGDMTAVALLDHLSNHLTANRMTEIRVGIGVTDTDTAQRDRYQALGFTPSLWLFQCPLPLLNASTDNTVCVRPAAHRDQLPLSLLFRDYLIGEEQRADFFRLRPDIDWQHLITAKRRCRDRILLVAEYNNQLSGFIDISLTPSMLSHIRSLARWGWQRLRRQPSVLPVWRRTASVQGIYTAPDYQRHGIATALLHHAAARACQQGAIELHAPIWAANHVSQAFFRRQGLTPARLILRRPLRTTG